LINWGNNPRKRRDRLYIIAEILDIAREGALKTQIMYKANLSFAQLNEYLDLLVKLKLVDTIPVNDKTVYKTSLKGLEYMQSYKEIIELLRNSNDKPTIKGGPPIYNLKSTS